MISSGGYADEDQEKGCRAEPGSPQLDRQALSAPSGRPSIGPQKHLLCRAVVRQDSGFHAGGHTRVPSWPQEVGLSTPVGDGAGITTTFVFRGSPMSESAVPQILTVPGFLLPSPFPLLLHRIEWLKIAS